MNRDEGSKGRLTALDLLAGERLADVVHPGSAVLLRNDDPEKPELGHSLDRLHVEPVLDVVLDRVRQDLLVDEAPDGRLHLALLWRQVEVH